MLEKPDFPEERIITCLQDAYGLLVVQIAFLPLGADRNTAVYRAVAGNGSTYFVKLRRGNCDQTVVALPKFLSEQNITQIIAPLTTLTGQLWASLDVFKVILYAFIEGSNGYEIGLSDRQWIEFGAVLKRIHQAVVPPALHRHIRQETYSPQARETVRMVLAQVESEIYDEPVAQKLAAFLQTKRRVIIDLVDRAEQLAQALHARSPAYVLCHSDIHAGNILIGADGAFYIVDWDETILAPKERDLMFIGGGLMGAKRTADEEQRLFYQGYGETAVDLVALAYYRYDRIVQDITAFCEQILLTDEGGDDREQSFRYLTSNFQPDSTIAKAYQTDMMIDRTGRYGVYPYDK